MPLGDPAKLIPLAFAAPGDIADPSGDIWLNAFGDRVIHGEMPTTANQARAAVAHGWEIVLGTEQDGTVIVRRAGPDPGHD